MNSLLQYFAANDEFAIVVVLEFVLSVSHVCSSLFRNSNAYSITTTICRDLLEEVKLQTFKAHKQMDAILERTYRPNLTATFFVVAFTLLASWVYPHTHKIWDSVDESTFYFLNGSLDSPNQIPGWATLWAILNVRILDFIPLVIMGLVIVVPGFTFPRERVRTRLIAFTVLSGYLLLFREVFHQVVKLFDWNHPGPSLVYEPAFLLSENYPALHPKDHSAHSFPGDHAAVLMLWVGYIFLTARKKRSLFVIATAIIFTLPRLFGGAHSLSDIVVGGGFVSLITLCLVGSTPLLESSTAKASKIVDPMLDRVLGVFGWKSYFPSEFYDLESDRHGNSGQKNLAA